MTDNEDILFYQQEGKEGLVGVITLNRPKALNALTLDMCLRMHESLNLWLHNKDIKCIAIKGSGDKAFCAGGDVRYLYNLAKQNEQHKIKDFFWHEYRLNYLIQSYSKPFVALMDGVSMGGGVGVSVHGTHRVATERLYFAMPETKIGFFPDIGGSYFLSRCPGELGTYLALTGEVINAADLMYCGLADHFVSSVHVDDIIQALANTELGDEPNEDISKTLKSFEVIPEPPSLASKRHIIDECFSKDSVEEILQSLTEDENVWTDDVKEKMLQQSPTSLKVTLREIREGINKDFKRCMQMEFRLCQRFTQDHDFFEGVRAAIVEKDNKPQWKPSQLSEVSDAIVNSYFEPLPGGELVLE